MVAGAPGGGTGYRRRNGRARAVQHVDELQAVMRAASRDAGQVPVDLLGDYLPLLADAATSGRRLDRAGREAVGALGRRAAEQGVPVGRAVDLYLSATWRLWRRLPVVSDAEHPEAVRVAGEAMLRVVNDTIAALADGYLAARRQMVRREEAMRRDLIDDLLRGDPDVGGIVERVDVRPGPDPRPPGRPRRPGPPADRDRGGDQCPRTGHSGPLR